MELGSGRDTWRLKGYCPNHPRLEPGELMPSTPVSFDEENETFTTLSGSTYKIVSYDGKKEEVIEQIKKDISNGGYEKH
jgi:hypothetical protein